MAVVTGEFLAALFTNFRAWFSNQFLAAINAAEWREIAQRVPSNTDTESYNLAGTTPKMQDVTHGEPDLNGLPPYTFSIQNKLWKAVIELKRTVIEDDKYDLLMPRISQLAQEAVRHPGELIFNLFEDNGLAYDGTAFFSTTRVIGSSANINNLLTGAGVTVAAFQADLAAARSAMRLFQDDRGRPQNTVADTIVVPPQLEQLAYQALNANQGTINQPVVPAGDGSLYRQRGYTVVVNPFLTDANDWYLLYCRGAYKPFLFQERLAPAMETVTLPNNETTVLRDSYIYTVRARYNVGYQEPRMAVKTTNV